MSQLRVVDFTVFAAATPVVATNDPVISAAPITPAAAIRILAVIPIMPPKCCAFDQQRSPSLSHARLVLLASLSMRSSSKQRKGNTPHHHDHPNDIADITLT